jgi:DNA/RNA-binding domain of Phe-tRNA-synthetase-like protein
MQLLIEEALQSCIAGVMFGVVVIDGMTVREHDELLWSQIEVLSERLARQYALDGLAEHQQIAAVRGMQKAFGFDPTRYRPSSEALLRRILKGQGLHSVNTAVDVNNFCSLEFLLPMCMYDLAKVRGQIRIRLGRPQESYQGIGRQVFHMAGKVIVADDEGVMGNTVSDSERTKVIMTTTTMLMLICAPASSDAYTIGQYATLAGERVVAFNGGQVREQNVLIA